jgi:S-adenosylmethionine:tRNA ribosyltransferase-isomerase
VRTSDFDYPLPPELIAQTPAARRDASRLLVLDRATGSVAHQRFPDLLLHLRPGDVLVLNDSRVIPARLRGVKPETGGEVELLLTGETSPNEWWCLVRPGKRIRPGTRIVLLDHKRRRTGIEATALGKNAEGHCHVRFTGTASLRDELDELGEMPLPPYIGRPAGADDEVRYQTVYARPEGSVAAPTAGLHFTPEMLARIRKLGVQTHFVTLHVGLGTFAPVKADRIEDHVMHEERYEVGAETAAVIEAARAAGGRIIAVGTTSVRVLETVAAAHDGRIVAGSGRTRIFIHPPFRFRVVDALLTNFHLPQSTLLMLVSAFAAPDETRGREMLLAAYAGAVRERYRFFSYGDAMLIL